MSIAEILLENVSGRLSRWPEIVALARKTGLRLLREDGWVKVRGGIMSTDEMVMCTAL